MILLPLTKSLKLKVFSLRQSDRQSTSLDFEGKRLLVNQQLAVK
jgi:hypothetical protein